MTEAHTADLIAGGADRVIVVDHPHLEIYRTEPYTKALAHVIEAFKPGIGFVGATTLGRDLAPRVSARVRTGLTADCTSLEIEDGSRNLLMTRPAFGGNIMATIICPEHRPQMSTVRPGVMRRLERDDSRKGEVIAFSAELGPDDLNVEVLEVVMEQARLKNIEVSEDSYLHRLIAMTPEERKARILQLKAHEKAKGEIQASESEES